MYAIQHHWLRRAIIETNQANQYVNKGYKLQTVHSKGKGHKISFLELLTLKLESISSLSSLLI